MPDPKDLARFDPDGDLWETDPDSCCHIRKTEPLDAEIAQFGGWVTGRKRYQTAERGVLPHFELTSDDRIKVNPLAYFSDADVNAYKVKHGLPEHPLFAKGYKSIGCAPCTTIVAEGEDPRAGRWRGLNKKECGIHFDFNGAIAKPVANVERNLWKDGAFIADPFHAWAEGDDPATVRYTHVPLPVFLANREAVLANPHPLGPAGRRRATRSRTSPPISAASPRSPSAFPASPMAAAIPRRVCSASATATPASCARSAMCCTTRSR